jgi:hypothetical protein
MFPQEMFRGTNKLPKADMAMSIENCVPGSATGCRRTLASGAEACLPPARAAGGMVSDASAGKVA